jgi:hypothetical protein
MRTNNKMDFEVEFEEWWEVGKEYFTKKLEKNLVQHKVDERIQVGSLSKEISFVAI